MPPSPPLRTVREPFGSYRSSLTNALRRTRFLSVLAELPSRYALAADAHSGDSLILSALRFVGSCTGRFRFRHLPCFLSRFLKLSRDVRPRGSLPAFAENRIALIEGVLIRLITGQHSLFPLSFTRCRMGSILRRPYPEGRHRAYHVPCTYLCGLGPTYSPVVQHLRQTRLYRLFLTTHLLVQAYQHLSLVNFHDVYRWFTYVDHTTPS